MSSLAMTRQERETFLAETHVGVISIERPDRAPLTVPIWYGYEPGGAVTIITSKGSVKAALIDESGRFSLCAQSEVMPYKYVSVEGAVTSIEPFDVEADLRPMSRRYLGDEMGDAYVDSEPPGDNVTIRMQPQRWYTVDYAKMAAPTPAD